MYKYMKKLFAQFLLFAVTIVSMAQTQNVYEWKNGTITIKNSYEIDSITFSIPNELFSVATDTILDVTATTMTASFSANYWVNSSTDLIAKGICYSPVNQTPTVNDSTQMFGYLGSRYWNSVLTGLKPVTTYYFRPFLKYNDNVVYGTVRTFTTAETGWKSLGMGKFSDGFLWNAAEYFEVEIQQNELTSNQFRVVDPYAGILGDIAVDKYLEFSILPAGTEFEDYVLDAEYVVFNDYNMGLWNANYPEDVFALHPYRMGRTPDKWAFNVVLDYQENGLPGEVSLAPFYYLFSVGGGWDKTTANTISILFPGYVKRDYSASVNYAGIFTADDGTVHATADLVLGPDAKEVKAVVMPADADAAAIADAVAAGALDAVSVSAGRIEVPFNAEELGGSNFQIIVVVLADGNIKTIANDSFEYYGPGGNPWKSLGTGYYTDDVLLPLFYENGTTATYEVEILEHSENPGLYRIMNPYAKSVHPAGDDDYAPEGMYIEVNATDAEGVYIQQQSLGMDWGYGEMQLVSNGARYLAAYEYDVVKGAGYLGKVTEGVITFPTFTQDNGATYQAILYMGSSGYLAGMNGKMEIVLPGANTFARNMAIAKANTTKREMAKKAFSGVKAGLDIQNLKKSRRALDVQQVIR